MHPFKYSFMIRFEINKKSKMKKVKCEVLKDNFFKGKSKGDLIELSQLELKTYSVEKIKACKKTSKK